MTQGSINLEGDSLPQGWSSGLIGDAAATHWMTETVTGVP